MLSLLLLPTAAARASSNDARNIFLKLLSYYICAKLCVVCSSVWRALESASIKYPAAASQWVMQFSYSSVHGGAVNISHNFSSFTSSHSDHATKTTTARVKNHILMRQMMRSFIIKLNIRTTRRLNLIEKINLKI